MQTKIAESLPFGKNPKELRIRSCLRGGDQCSCILLNEGFDDEIATPELKAKFRKALCEDSECTFDEWELRGYLLAALFSMQERKYEEAGRYIQYFDLKCCNGFFFRTYPFLYYYVALIAYGINAYKVAEKYFQVYLQNDVHKGNEIAYLHFGNCYFRQRQWDKALAAYETALELRKDFPEVLINIGIIAKHIGDNAMAEKIACTPELFHGIFVRGTLCENPLEYSLAIPQDLSIWDIPIFINARDRLGMLQRLVNWVVNAGYRRIYILDNDSTYPPLLSYYQTLERVPAIQVVRLGRNIGHTALWNSGILEILKIDTPYVYSDPDVVPVEECPVDVLEYMLAVLRKYPFLRKVGLGLKTDDISFYNAEEQKYLESLFYKQLLEDNLYFCQVDTTFALYRNYRHYEVFGSARTVGKRMAYHLPWYLDYDNLPEDEQYYIAHANQSSTLSTNFKKREMRA